MGKEDREPRAVLVSVCGLNLVTSHKCVMQCVFVGGRGGGGGGWEYARMCGGQKSFLKVPSLSLCRDQTQVSRLDGKHLYLLNHLIDLEIHHL